jgi:NitT/TauT family transport system substrate-binding protein
VDGVGLSDVRKNEIRRFVVVMLAAVLFGCRGSKSESKIRSVRLAIHVDPIVFLPFHIAHDFGYYQEEGIEVAMSEVAGGSKAMQALLGGSVDVAVASISDAIQLAAEGRDLRCFLILDTRPSIAVVVAPAMSGRIRAIRDLKGRPVGVSTPGSASHQALNALLVSNGLSPEDVSAVAVGMAGTSLAALEYGKVDAAVLLASAITTFEGRHPGQRFLADTRTPDGARRVFGSEIFPNLTLIAEENWLHSNADSARRLARAVKRAMLWVRDHPAEQVRDVMTKEMGRPDSDDDLQAIRQLQQTMSSDGVVPAAAVEAVATFVAISNKKVRTAHIDLSKIYTNEFGRDQ